MFTLMKKKFKIRYNRIAKGARSERRGHLPDSRQTPLIFVLSSFFLLSFSVPSFVFPSHLDFSPFANLALGMNQNVNPAV